MFDEFKEYLVCYTIIHGRTQHFPNCTSALSAARE
jgi:hypothetical protein